MVAHRVGNEELSVLRPAIVALGEPNLLFAKRLAVRGGGILLMRRAIADVAVQNDEGRPILGLVKHVERVLDAIDVIGVAHAQNIPAITEKAGRDVLGKGDARIAFDGDVIVVVNPAEVIEREMAGERCRFRTHALHHAAVAAHRINVVVEDLEAGPIVAVREPCFSDRHANAGGDALPERPSCCLHPRNQMVLGVSRSLAAEMAEVTNIVERHRGLPEPLVVGVHGAGAGEVEHRPQQHRSMAVGEHEAIPVGPNRILRIEMHHAVPQRVDERG